MRWTTEERARKAGEALARYQAGGSFWRALATIVRHGVPVLVAGRRKRQPEPEFALEPYDPLAKRRRIFDRSGHEVAWVDYDDTNREEADAIAEAMLAGLNDPSRLTFTEF